MSDQDKDEPGGRRERLCGSLPKAMVDEVREIVEQLGFGATISGFMESALRREMDRVRAEGIVPPRQK